MTATSDKNAKVAKIQVITEGLTLNGNCVREIQMKGESFVVFQDCESGRVLHVQYGELWFDPEQDRFGTLLPNAPTFPQLVAHMKHVGRGARVFGHIYKNPDGTYQVNNWDNTGATRGFASLDEARVFLMPAIAGPDLTEDDWDYRKTSPFEEVRICDADWKWKEVFIPTRK